MLGFGTSDTAIRSAISRAQQCAKPLHFAAANYTYAGTLPLGSLDVYGDGPQSSLVASRPDQMALTLTGSGGLLRDLRISCPSCSSRLTTPQSAAVNVNGASNFVVSGVTIDRAGSAGIFLYGASFGQVTGNVVANTLADGIHVTHGAHDVDIALNAVRDTGDDFVGVVGYESDGSRPHRIVVRDNTLTRQPWGRGVSVIGAYDVDVLRNSISNTYGAGILLASEPAWLTFGTDDVQVAGNVIRSPDQGNIHNANILVSGLRIGYPVTAVWGAGNDCDAPKPAVRREGNYSNVTVTCVYGA